ncbi:uncharacterized protein METZ01_LOCUS265109, partial [marine metagenome]
FHRIDVYVSSVSKAHYPKYPTVGIQSHGLCGVYSGCYGCLPGHFKIQVSAMTLPIIIRVYH